MIALKDRSLYERLQRLLPRPDYPWDEFLKKLIEQPAKVSAEKLNELERRLENIEQRISPLATGLDELRDTVKALTSTVSEIKKVLQAVRNALEGGAACGSTPYLAVLVPVRVEDGNMAQPQPAQSQGFVSQRDAEAAVIGDEVHIGGGGGQLQYHSKYVQAAVELARASGGCVRYSELAKRLGMNRLSGGITELLLKNGFVRKEKGLYCLPEAEVR